MSTEIATNQTFEQRVYDRMRANIGELMTDEEMKKLLETAITKMFFTAKTTEGRYYNERTVEQPEIYKIVKELVEPKLKAALSEYLAEHADEVNAAIKQAMAGGFAGCIAAAINGLMSQPFFDLQQKLQAVVCNNNLRN